MLERLEKEVDMLERHLDVLGLVVENEPIGIVRLSQKTGHPHHKIRYSLRLLEEESLIEPSNDGATTTDRTEAFIQDYADRMTETILKLTELKIDQSQNRGGN